MLLALVAGRARGEDPPPQDSIDAAVADAARAIGNVRKLGPGLGLDAAAAAPAACADLETPLGRCAARDPTPCMDSLERLYDRLVELRGEPDPIRSGAAEYLAAGIATATLRLAAAREAITAGRCDHVGALGTHPSRIVVGGDGRTILVEPLRPLRAGRRYALVVEGLSHETAMAMKASIVPVAARQAEAGDPVGTLTVPPRALSDVVSAAVAHSAAGIRLDEAVAFAGRLAVDASSVPALAPFGGAQVTLPGPLRPELLATLRAYFAPRGRTPPGETLAIFRVLDARTGLAAYREAIRGAKCPESPLVALRAADVRLGTASHVAGVFHGQYPSLDIGGGEGAARLLGVSASAARPVSQPLLLAVPVDVRPTAPLVIGVNGHGSEASGMLSAHADALAARGMALMAIELPAQGERHVAGREFLDPLAPATLAVNVRQAVVDVMAIVHTVRRCGILLPDGRRLVPSDVRYLGYSLGGMIGAVARAVEPDIGVAVLVAPAGDMTSWMMLRVILGLGSEFVTCIGGERNGGTCLRGPPCPEPGVCAEEPSVARLKSLVELPYRLALGGSDPLSFAGQPGGAASRAPLLIVTGGEDEVLYPLLATRLADAYRLRPSGTGRRHGGRASFVQWPAFGHNLVTRPEVREQAYAFLARAGRRARTAWADPEPQGRSDGQWTRR
jgi:hypothetical protein